MNQSRIPASPPVPIPNSYWVIPGRLLAGEYPGGDRLQGLLLAGVDSFIDLTAAGELDPYESLLPAGIEHWRGAIVDHGLPTSPAHMSGILDAIDSALERGRSVYVHCRAGIGRTGTTIACHLMRKGLAPHDALDRLNDLWRQCARSKSWSSIPETDEQYRYVQEWREEPSRGSIDTAQRCEGALLGLVCGEAPDGAAGSPGFGVATTLCVIDSLHARGGNDSADQMHRYADWLRTEAGKDAPADFRRAVAASQWSRRPNAGSHDPKNVSSHSMARSLAAALYQWRSPQAALELAADISRTTQQSPVVLDACRLWTAVLVDALSGAQSRDVIELRDTPAVALLRTGRVRVEVSALFDAGWRKLPARADDAVSMCISVLRAFDGAADFMTALQGTSGATAGAMTGSLAGACFGFHSIPAHMYQSMPRWDSLRAMAKEFG